MKNNWQTKKLNEVCTIKGRIGYRGYTKQDLVEKGKGAISLSPSNIIDNKINFKKCTYISWFKYNESPEIKINNGDIIYCKTASIGKIALIEDLPEKATINPQFVVLKDLKCLNKYLYFFMISGKFKDQINGIIGGTAVPTLSQENLGNLEIPIPSLFAQKCIVKILDEVFEKIKKAKENTKKNLENSKELFDSYLQNVFANPEKDWEEKALKEIGKTQTGLTPKTVNKSYYGNFVPFITPADVDILGNGSIDYESRGLSENGLKVGRRIEKNSILMVCIGATIGKVGFTNQVVSCNQQINTLTPLDKYEAKIFYYILSTKFFLNKIIKGSSQATLPIINKGKWENLLIVVPPIQEQKAIVKKLDELSMETKKLEGIYKQKLADLEELKKSILQKAFSGAL